VWRCRFNSLGVAGGRNGCSFIREGSSASDGTCWDWDWDGESEATRKTLFRHFGYPLNLDRYELWSNLYQK
jgi:hypothetical protein